MAEELTPPKASSAESETGGSGGVGLGGESKAGGRRGSASAEGVREEVLRELAKACKRQGNFHLACKKYTQVCSWSHFNDGYDVLGGFQRSTSREDSNTDRTRDA